jgi:hypothetical protein
MHFFQCPRNRELPLNSLEEILYRVARLLNDLPTKDYIQANQH